MNNPDRFIEGMSNEALNRALQDLGRIIRRGAWEAKRIAALRKEKERRDNTKKK